MKSFEDIDLVNYVINKGATLKETAEFFGVSVETVKKRMKVIKGSLKSDSKILFDLQQVADKNTLDGRKKGGTSNNSGVVRTVSLEEISEIAMIMLSEDFTIDDASQHFGIPSSTLYEHLELLNCNEYQEIYCDLKSLYSYHNKYKNGTSNIDGSAGVRDIEKLQVKYFQKLGDIKQNKR